MSGLYTELGELNQLFNPASYGENPPIPAVWVNTLTSGIAPGLVLTPESSPFGMRAVRAGIAIAGENLDVAARFGITGSGLHFTEALMTDINLIPGLQRKLSAFKYTHALLPDKDGAIKPWEGLIVGDEPLVAENFNERKVTADRLLGQLGNDLIAVAGNTLVRGSYVSPWYATRAYAISSVKH